MKMKEWIQNYKGHTIMQESCKKTFMILRERKWWEFCLPNPIVMVRDINSMSMAKKVLDEVTKRKK